ncbi:MAG: S-layer homology domain-containing protein, partial [Clostridia bacterium]|nr:S-layer homology domain-containing protein [Clostridia bacterium]
MLSTNALKKICACLAALMLAASAPVYSEGTVIVPQVEDGGEVQPPATDKETQPEAVPVNISGNYFKEEDGSYSIIFSSLDVLSDLKAFNFTVSFTSAELVSYDFDSKLNDSEASITRKGGTVVFQNGSSSALQSGKLTLCSIRIKTDAVPTADSIAFTDFTALNAEGNTVTFAPTLSIKEGPVVPKLSENEQSVYDMITALPDAGTLSFYNEDKSLADISALKSAADTAAAAYDKLTSSEKANIEAVLAYNMKNSDALTELPPILAGMENVGEVISLASMLNSAEDSALIDYLFALNVYNTVKDNISASGIPENSTAYSQYTAAKSVISSKETALNRSLAEASLNDRLKSIDRQLTLIQSMSSDKHYNEYLSELLDISNKLYKDIESSNDEYKDYMCERLNEEINKIKAIQNGVSSLPTVTYPTKINVGVSYTVELKREKKAAIEAKATVNVYEDDELIDTKSFNLAEGTTSAELRMLPSKNVYPSDGKVTVSVTYTVADAQFDLGSEELKCTLTAKPSSGTSGFGTSGSSSSDSGSGGTTKFPEANDKNDKDDKDDNSENNNTKPQALFNDIDNYGWAKDAIEGLYYAGIVNGMEDG